MFSTKLINLVSTNPNNKNFRCRTVIHSRHFSKKWTEIWSGKRFRDANVMNLSAQKFRIYVRFTMIPRLYSAFARCLVGNAFIKRCAKDRALRDWWTGRFRQSPNRPRIALLFTTVSAAYKNNEEKPGTPVKCSKNISDDEMKALISDIEGMEELAKATLFCVSCSKRVIIDNQHPGVRYCACEHAHAPVKSYDGWEPYMEAEDVVIWRKEYKPGGLYAYKVYGRYKQITAEDFAAIQVDGAYRTVWDSAVANLSVVEKEANGTAGQDVLHWEVLWPRLFSNRDYVYIRRHKEFSVHESCMAHKEAIFSEEDKEPCGPITGAVGAVVPMAGRSSVHDHAKRAAQEQQKLKDAQNAQNAKAQHEQNAIAQHKQNAKIQPPATTQAMRGKENVIYVIISRSCQHPQVPEAGSPIRVTEYWSHMVIKTLNGPNKEGMEFVLTYYDEPAVGGLPNAVMSWAMGRAGPAFLAQMRAAAVDYQAWKKRTQKGETPDFKPEPVAFKGPVEPRREQEDLESSKESPELNASDAPKLTTLENAPITSKDNVTSDVGNDVREVVTSVVSNVARADAGGLTTDGVDGAVKDEPCASDRVIEKMVIHTNTKDTEPRSELKQVAPTKAEPITVSVDKPAEESENEHTEVDEEDKENLRWWRYLVPSYYFA